MSYNQNVQQCVLTFINRDYDSCAQQAMALLTAGTSLEVLQLLMISLQRLGRTDSVEQLGSQLLAATSEHPWVHELLQLTLDQTNPDQLLAQAQTEEQRCQVLYYLGARCLTMGLDREARKAFSACLALDTQCLERQLAQAELNGAAPPDLQEATEDPAEEFGRLSHQAEELHQQGHHEEAILLATNAKELAREHLGETHPVYASILNNLAEYYGAIGNHTMAETLHRQSLEIRRTTLGEDHFEFSNSLHNLACLYMERGNYASADTHLKQALEIRRVTCGEDHPAFANTLSKLLELYLLRGDYAAVKALGESYPDFANTLHSFAFAKQTSGNYGAAEALYRYALEIRRQVLGEHHPHFALSLNNLGGLYYQLGKYTAAEPLYRQALEIRRRALGESHPDFANSLHNLAFLYMSLGVYPTAEPLFRQALEVRGETLGAQHPDFARTIYGLASLYLSMGNYRASEPLYRQALTIFRDVLGEKHRDFAVTLSGLALACQSMGNIRAAEPLYRQASSILREVVGEAHPDFAANLHNFACMYLSLGDYPAAESLYRQALEIQRGALGEHHPAFAAGLVCLAELYLSMGNIDMAQPLYWQATGIIREALGENHPAFADTLHNHAGFLLSAGIYKAALPLYLRALEVRRQALGESHPNFADSLTGLAVLYASLGDYSAAEPLYRQASEIFRVALGEDSSQLALSLRNLAVLYIATGREVDVMPLLEQVAAIHDRWIGQVFSISSESQRMAFLKTIQGDIDVFLCLVSQFFCRSTEAARTALELVLRRKAIGAEALAAQRDAVLAGRYPALEPALRQWASLRMQIAQKTLAGPGPAGLQAHQQRLTQWTSQKDSLEAELSRQIPEMNLEQTLRAADRRAVALALPEGVSLVEFVRFDVFDFKAVPARGERHWQPARYLAFVLPAGKPDSVQMLDLGEAEPIDRLIADFREGITGEAQAGTDRNLVKRRTEPVLTTREDPGSRLRAAVFDKLIPALAGHQRLLLAPDGDLTRLPFEVLPSEDGHLLIDTYQISYLGCGRDVLRFGAASSGQPAEPLVVSDPDFDLGTATVAAQPSTSSSTKAGFWSRLFAGRKTAAPAASQPVPQPEPAGRTGGRRSRDFDHSRYHFGRLPGTRAEGERIAGLLGVRPWLDTAVLEGRLKQQCRSPRILHLATHGFFLQDQPHDPNREGRNFGMLGGPTGALGRLSGLLPENPLLRSGLALAGANTWLRHGSLPPEAEDGLLTAEDVSGLDLLATELVVLSACETGLGEVRTGEGVFGLQRAFVLAGAKTLVMSLWSVPDEPTRELMEDFYQRILNGQPRAAALREAQRTLRAKYPDPYYWGAFVCLGDPGPLRLNSTLSLHQGACR